MQTRAINPTSDADRAAALIDDMGEDSFPASDPPAVWTWEVAPLDVSTADRGRRRVGPRGPVGS